MTETVVATALRRQVGTVFEIELMHAVATGLISLLLFQLIFDIVASLALDTQEVEGIVSSSGSNWLTHTGETKR